MKHANLSPTTDQAPLLSVGLKNVSQPEFADALTQQLGKRRVTIILAGAATKR